MGCVACLGIKSEFDIKSKELAQKLKEMRKCKELILTVDFTKVSKIQENITKMQLIKDDIRPRLIELENIIEKLKKVRKQDNYEDKEAILEKYNSEFNELDEIRQEDALEIIEEKDKELELKKLKIAKSN